MGRGYGTRKSLLKKERALKTKGGVKRKMVQECREEGQRKEREGERLAKKEFSKDPLGSNVAFIGLLSAKHWSRVIKGFPPLLKKKLNKIARKKEEVLQNRVTKASASSSPGCGGGGFERETRCKNCGRSWRKRETESWEENEG